MDNKIAVYPGTFDPITYGHLDVIKRATKLFDELVVAVADSNRKGTVFSTDERFKMVKHLTKDLPNVKVTTFSGMIVDHVKSLDSHIIVRAIRTFSDFEYEFQMALANRKLESEVETIFIMSSEEMTFISSSLLKDAASLGGDMSHFVPEYVAEKLRAKLCSKKKK